jgi:hypothetical protein
MERRSLALRMQDLEKTVNGLQKLPAQVAALDTKVAALDTKVGAIDARLVSLEEQFVQFRTETRVEFSAVRREMREGFNRVDLEFAAVRQEIRQGDEETRRFMRVLHEDVIARIAALGDQPRG